MTKEQREVIRRIRIPGVVVRIVGKDLVNIQAVYNANGYQMACVLESHTPEALEKEIIRLSKKALGYRDA